MKFELPQLPYSYDALQPYMSKETLELHHGKHLLAYVNNLNTLKEGTEFETADLDTIVKKSNGGIFNNGGQLWNHISFFESFSPSPKSKPEGSLLNAIERDFGSFESFKEEYEKAGASLFGSGWVWLSLNSDGNLVISQEANAGNPLTKGNKPLLGCDVWEHSYYVDYKNRRVEYLKNFWDIVDWSVIEKRF